ncbi:MAG: hypothetical protein V4568_19455 [Pseudomonadota bacterium]
MLLSLRNRLTVALCPTHIAVMELNRGWRPTPSNPQTFTCPSLPGEPAWHAPIAALRHWLEKNQRNTMDVEVIVSDRFVRYAQMPWSDEVQRPSEMAVFSRIHFEALFGESAADWEIQTDYCDYEKGGIGCGIDKALIDALRTLLATYKMQLTSLQPYFMRAFNRWRNDLSQNALLCVIESGQCVLASHREGAWHSIRNVRLTENADIELPALIAREILLQGLENQCAVYVHTLDKIDTTHLRQAQKANVFAVPGANNQMAGYTMLQCNVL